MSTAKPGQKTIIAVVEPKFHREVAQYAKRNERTIVALVRHALRFYMNAHPSGIEQEEARE